MRYKYEKKDNGSEISWKITVNATNMTDLKVIQYSRMEAKFVNGSSSSFSKISNGNTIIDDILPMLRADTFGKSMFSPEVNQGMDNMMSEMEKMLKAIFSDGKQ